MRYSLALLLAVCIGLDNITQVQGTLINSDKRKQGKSSAKKSSKKLSFADDPEILKEIADSEIDKEFQNFKLKFNKNIQSTSEQEHRKLNFLKNRKKIKDFQANPNKTSKVDVNKLADLDDEELQSLMSLKLDPIDLEIDVLVDEEEKLKKELRAQKRAKKSSFKKSKTRNQLSLIESDINFNDFIEDNNQLAQVYQTEEPQCEHEDVFWTGDNGWMLDDVQNQGKCGSCWAYTAVEAMEAALAIHTGSFVKLSIQYLVDCMTYACSGGLITTVFGWSVDNPVPERDNYREYDGISSTCTAPIDSLGVSAVKFQEVDKTKEALIDALHQQPVSGAVQADSSDFVYYSGGLISGEDCGHSVNHAIMIVGYGCLEETNTDYFLIKNSWGTEWGDNGFVRIAASNSDHIYGTCGIFRLNSYPDFDGMEVRKITTQPDQSNEYTK